MHFEWNQTKNRDNLGKHKLSFDTACQVFDDPYHLSIQDRSVAGELRWQTLGMVQDTVIVLVAHTVDVIEDGKEDVIRLISARKATRRERKIYEQTYKKAARRS